MAIEPFNFAFGNPDKWQGAHCLDIPDPDYFFPVNAAEALDREPIIARICNKCPVKQDCLQMALDAKDFEGYFGGTSPEERRKMSEGKSRVKRGGSREVNRLRGIGFNLHDALKEVGITLGAYQKYTNRHKQDKDKK
jgi:WhiB family redox-sensing transcriptional regulator